MLKMAINCMHKLAQFCSIYNIFSIMYLLNIELKVIKQDLRKNPKSCCNIKQFFTINLMIIFFE